ncbi:hypothetical protein L210DRAFT_3761299 [Boletus edulis BED1]|uniref:Uncharacterized protein n=1 Tax=Boletus edulis BED1 TaxID=1328754 RepID=A0AAD4GDT3_BOLED|nr:hypothetical protein L210DRAFT_3761299 [Boletus edulis BED1]
MVAPVPQPLPALEVPDPPTEFLDQTTVTERVEIPRQDISTGITLAHKFIDFHPSIVYIVQVQHGQILRTAIPAAIQDKISPPEQFSLTKFINFPLPLCILSESNLDRYFAPLPPDTTLISELVVALKMAPTPTPRCRTQAFTSSG